MTRAPPSPPGRDTLARREKAISKSPCGFSFSQIIITPLNLGKKLDVNYRTASRYVAEVAKGNVLHESYVGKYHLYANKPLLKLLRS
ncbi:MAG: hypothetical protein AAB393_03995 [Bacteroidota bacterium]